MFISQTMLILLIVSNSTSKSLQWLFMFRLSKKRENIALVTVTVNMLTKFSVGRIVQIGLGIEKEHNVRTHRLPVTSV